MVETDQIPENEPMAYSDFTLEMATQKLVYSGQRLDVDPGRGLVSECDFILAATPPVPPLLAPIATIVEAKKNDIEIGLGQCVAQMVAAEMFDQSAGFLGPTYGCVMTGEVWQFLRLSERVTTIDQQRYYLSDVPGILGAIQAILAQVTPNSLS